ncbi:TadE/TadG family type IV pilus assembly protein [Albibacillus kandeliae]|uniref:TadE/TadG family type IV pilus assembly protein n=1 Tax=Albibacillus kandeliae TaxID=2174228 RepID=UPI000D68BE5D|nr:TadE/TadG family type IV pilus assembly protein [Albibacillus kandeliae]
MTARLLRAVRRFRRSESGTATVEFAITFPAMLVMLLSGVELGMISLQHAMLERAMDITVRDIRLGTGSAPQHDDIKDLICERAGFIRDCSDNLLLEMVQVDPRDWSGVADNATCTDRSEEVNPKTEFKSDAPENALMLLRACAKIDPIFPSTGLGANLAKDDSGQFALVAISAFVQEPE